VLTAFLKAIEQLGDPAIRRVLWIGLGASALLFALVWLAAGVLLSQVALSDIGWVDTLLDALGAVATLLLTWLLFPAVVSTTVGLLLDGVADAVEKRHYPALPKPRPQPLSEVLTSTLQLLALLVVVNLLLLPLLLVPVLFPIAFYGANGYILGREYFELVAFRRLAPAEAKQLRRRHGRRLLLFGVVLALLLTVPLVNLLAPLIGTAAMVHVFQQLQRQAQA